MTLLQAELALPYKNNKKKTDESSRWRFFVFLIDYSIFLVVSLEKDDNEQKNETEKIHQVQGNSRDAAQFLYQDKIR